MPRPPYVDNNPQLAPTHKPSTLPKRMVADLQKMKQQQQSASDFQLSLDGKGQRAKRGSHSAVNNPRRVPKLGHKTK